MKTTIRAIVMVCLAAYGTGEACAADLPVKVMTFNIRFNNPADGPNRWSERRELAAEVVRRFDGDFVGLQEALPDQTDDLLEMLPEYRSIGDSRVPGERNEASPIFYRRERWRLDAYRHGTFWLSDTPHVPGSITWGNKYPRIVTWGRFVERRTGRGIYVFNTHFSHVSATSREKGAALLARRIACRDLPDPVLVTGDFNTTESSKPVKYLTDCRSASPVQLIDTFRALHPSEQNVGTFHAFTGEPEPDKIDYVFTTPCVVVISAEIVRFNCDGRWPSDHLPVMAEVVFNTTTRSRCCGRLRGRRLRPMRVLFRFGRGM